MQDRGYYAHISSTEAPMTSPIHKKTFSLHRDDGAYYPDPQSAEECWKFGQEIDTVREAVPPRLEPNKKVARPYNRTQAKWNNPIALFYVLDYLVNARRGAYIRSSYLAQELSRAVPHYHWRAASIGRMLGGLYDSVAEHYERAEGNEEFPIGRGRDARGQYYVIDPHGGIEGFLWLVKARDVVYKMSEEVMLREQQGDLDHSLIGSGEPGFGGPAEYYFDFLPGPIRDMEYYKAQLDDDYLYGTKMRNHRENLRSAF